MCRNNGLFLIKYILFVPFLFPRNFVLTGRTTADYEDFLSTENTGAKRFFVSFFITVNNVGLVWTYYPQKEVNRWIIIFLINWDLFPTRWLRF